MAAKKQTNRSIQELISPLLRAARRIVATCGKIDPQTETAVYIDPDRLRIESGKDSALWISVKPCTTQDNQWKTVLQISELGEILELDSFRMIQGLEGKPVNWMRYVESLAEQVRGNTLIDLLCYQAIANVFVEELQRILSYQMTLEFVIKTLEACREYVKTTGVIAQDLLGNLWDSTDTRQQFESPSSGLLNQITQALLFLKGEIVYHYPLEVQHAKTG